MNDVEHDLRELFERKASSVGGVAPRLPDQVRKRSRHREVGTALVSGLTVLALVVGSVAVVRSLDVGNADRTAVDDPWAGYEVYERTATVGNFTITSPSDWYLVNQWQWAARASIRLREQRERASEACQEEATRAERRSCRQSVPSGERGDGWVIPIAMLSLADHGLTSSPCLNPSFEVGAEDAVMTIARDELSMTANFGSGELPRWPVSFDEATTYDRQSCGPGTYVPFAAGDIPFVAHFAFGDEVSDEERQALIDAFEAMTVDDSTGILIEEGADSSAYVIAGGENAAGPWTLELSPSEGTDPASNISLVSSSAEGRGVALGDVALTQDHPIEQAGGDPVFGAVVKEATGVELRLEDGTPPIPAQIVPLPPSLPFDFDLFFAPNDSDVQATAVAMGSDGELLAPTESINAPTPTFLDKMEHLPSGQTWSPATTRQGDLVVMPITFPDGATAELVYPPSLGLEQLNVYPDAYADLEGERSDCGWPVHATRADPREGWLKGEGPLDRYVTDDGRTFELWRGHRPYTMLVTRTGPWNVLVSCSSTNAISESTARWAELLTPREAGDGLLILTAIPPLRLQLGDEGATVRLSNRDVIIDLSSGRAQCDVGSPDMGTSDEVVQWCIEPAGVYLYATAIGRAGTSILDGLVAGLEIRSYRPTN